MSSEDNQSPLPLYENLEAEFSSRNNSNPVLDMPKKVYNNINNSSNNKKMFMILLSIVIVLLLWTNPSNNYQFLMCQKCISLMALLLSGYVIFTFLPFAPYQNQ